jgi:hypothetical protein
LPFCPIFPYDFMENMEKIVKRHEKYGRKIVKR